MRRISVEEPLYSNVGANSCHMKCDYKLTNRTIKEPFPNKSHIMCISGPPASGKTSFVVSMLEKKPKNQASDSIFFRVFKDIIWCCPESSRSSITGENNPLQYANHIYDELNYDVTDIINANKKRYDSLGKNYSQLLILDDLGTHLNKSHELLNDLAMNHRHKNLSIWILIQYNISLPKSIRAQVGYPVIFKPSSQDLGIINKEYMAELSKDEYRHLINFVFKERHDFLMVDRSQSNTFYKNLGRIIFN